MSPLWTLFLILCLSPTQNSGFHYQGKEEADGTGSDFHQRTSMYFQYIIRKGCDYVKWFVWSHYMKDDHHRYHGRRRFLLESNNCDWQSCAEKELASGHVPDVLSHALIDCGPADSFEAIGQMDWHKSYHHCNMSDHGHHKRATDSREAIEQLLMLMTETDTEIPTNLKDILSSGIPVSDIRNTKLGVLSSDSDQSHTSTKYLLEDAVWLLSDKHIQNAILMKWCSRYSRRVERRFQLGTRKFEHTSPHWLVDVYKMGRKFATPTSYIHALVGCGQKYALDAFGVPSWLARAYNRG